MTKAITIRENNALYKYLICDQKENIIYCITNKSNSEDIKMK